MDTLWNITFYRNGYNQPTDMFSEYRKSETTFVHVINDMLCPINKKQEVVLFICYFLIYHQLSTPLTIQLFWNDYNIDMA